jgi:hypothetical protein
MKVGKIFKGLSSVPVIRRGNCARRIKNAIIKE